MQVALKFIQLHFLHSNTPCPILREWDSGLRVLILAQVITITLAFPTKDQSSRMVAATTAFEQYWTLRTCPLRALPSTKSDKYRSEELGPRTIHPVVGGKLVQTTKRKQQLAERYNDALVRSAPVLRLDRARSIDSPSHGPIDESIRIRDRHQFEIKLHYPISRKKKIASHDLECFIFVPRSLGLNRTNYSKARFYDDQQTHIRFKTPAVPLESIASHHASPLRKLALSADSMTQNDT